MRFWKIILSLVANRKPTVNQLDHNTLAKNIRTGSLYILRESAEGVKEVVEIGGGGGNGQSGLTPYIGTNGNWWIGATDTGVLASGQNGTTPHIGPNGNWWIGTVDTGVYAGGTVNLWKRTSGVIEPADGSNRLKINATGVSLELGGRASGEDAIEPKEFVTKRKVEGMTGGGSLQLEAETVTFSGMSILLTAGEALSKGNLCYMNSSGKMVKGDADAYATSLVFAMATDSISNDAEGEFLIYGIIGGLTGLTVGGMLYLSGTAGAATQTQPTGSNRVIQIVGKSISATHILFNPNLATIELL